MQQLARPAPQPAGRRVRRDQGGGVGLEKADVRARRGDRHLDRQQALPGEAAHHVPDQRGLAVAAGRNQEDLLAGGQVASEAIALALPVGERARRDDLAIDERVVGRHYAIIRNHYPGWRNGNEELRTKNEEPEERRTEERRTEERRTEERRTYCHAVNNGARSKRGFQGSKD